MTVGPLFNSMGSADNLQTGMLSKGTYGHPGGFIHAGIMPADLSSISYSCRAPLIIVFAIHDRRVRRSLSRRLVERAGYAPQRLDRAIIGLLRSRSAPISSCTPTYLTIVGGADRNGRGLGSNIPKTAGATAAPNLAIGEFETVGGSLMMSLWKAPRQWIFRLHPVEGLPRQPVDDGRPSRFTCAVRGTPR